MDAAIGGVLAQRHLDSTGPVLLFEAALQTELTGICLTNITDSAVMVDVSLLPPATTPGATQTPGDEHIIWRQNAGSNSTSVRAPNALGLGYTLAPFEQIYVDAATADAITAAAFGVTPNIAPTTLARGT